MIDALLTNPLLLQILAALAVAGYLWRGFVGIVDHAVAQSTSTRDDGRWARVRGNFYFLALSRLFEIVLGSGLPGTRPRE